jgi:hypothetical protein
VAGGVFEIVGLLAALIAACELFLSVARRVNAKAIAASNPRSGAIEGGVAQTPNLADRGAHGVVSPWGSL